MNNDGLEAAGASSTLVDRGLVWDAGLYARHTAAMRVVKRGIEDDRELLLSYVVWPSEMIDTSLVCIARQSVDLPTQVWR